MMENLNFEVEKKKILNSNFGKNKTVNNYYNHKQS